MNNSVRDYLYLDIDRVRSIYAQSSGGLIESIRELQEEIDTHSKEHQAENEMLSKNILLGSSRIATQVLHDYLFTSVEKKLNEKIIEVSKDTISDIHSGTLFRISGKVEIDDIERMQHIMENYNDVYKYLLTVGMASEIQEKVWELEDQLKAATHKNKSKIKGHLESLSPEEISSTILREQRAGVSPLISETFRRVYGLLYKDIFEVKIVAEFDNNAVFRGILNKEHLREAPTIMYAKYGTRPSVNWTMIGQVTTVQKPKVIDAETNISQDEQDVTYTKQGSNLRDAIEKLYNPIAEIEEQLIRSAIRTIWIATPLAIYHETS